MLMSSQHNLPKKLIEYITKWWMAEACYPFYRTDRHSSLCAICGRQHSVKHQAPPIELHVFMVKIKNHQTCECDRHKATQSETLTRTKQYQCFQARYFSVIQTQQ